MKDFHHPLLAKYERFLRDNGIHFAGIEFIQDQYGQIYTYDVNTNTNYNPQAEQAAGVSGMRAIAQFLAQALKSL
ncbi:hypothetical protein J2S00_000016 [Caldalkalibacillus uzonensis]|uniref:Alpha-L-glutamate ligase n=1 Tax=Caldalkalibacillus uzonensis TaxID=353224 RepID=A0ABU0CMX3_9BACI|nr:hypothetical protein [Caldalkalibacillus uzonensis]MDQ0337246.1 hypothetical protein [Caldalkalibacillus uzonensis]